MTYALNCKGVSATITRWPKNVLQPQKKFKPFDLGSAMSLKMKMVRICLYGTYRSIVLISRINHISSACMESLDISRLMNDDSYVARFFLHCTDIPGESLFLNIMYYFQFLHKRDLQLHSQKKKLVQQIFPRQKLHLVISNCA